MRFGFSMLLSYDFYESRYFLMTLKLKANPTASIAELPKNAAVAPAISKRKPPIKGPGTVAMLIMELAIPRIPPCSSVGVNRERKLGTIVRIIPLPEEIIVIDTRKTKMLVIIGIKVIPTIISKGPIGLFQCI
jgi:hypothetical protein